jgi:putative endonuclease
MVDTLEVGRRGERAAAHYLSAIGMRIVARNWRCRRAELDLVAWDGDTLVFCEVKTRRSLAAGTPEDAVDLSKQARIAFAATCYLATLEHEPECIRFDVVAIRPLGEYRAVVRHHRAAFEASGSS